MYFFVPVTRYNTDWVNYPIRLCDNTGQQCTKVGFLLSCNHFVASETTSYLETTFIFCCRCQALKAAYPYCADPSCKKFRAGFRFAGEDRFTCVGCARYRGCQAPAVSTGDCCQKLAVYNNGGFCRTHFSSKRTIYWVKKSIQEEASLCIDIEALLISYLQI